MHLRAKSCICVYLSVSDSLGSYVYYYLVSDFMPPHNSYFILICKSIV